MKDVLIFEDGKRMRGKRAKLIKRGNKRVLIEYTQYDYDTDEEFTCVVWFNLFIPSWSDHKKDSKHNNKRKYAKYCSDDENNYFYSDYYQTEKYKLALKESVPTYYESLCG